MPPPMSDPVPDESRLLREAAERGVAYLASLPMRRVAPTPSDVAGLNELPATLPDRPVPPERVLELLDRHGSPATVATNGGRYFGFVIGSSLPAAQAAGWLASAWNQNAYAEVMSPVAHRLEATSIDWIRGLLNLPEHSEGAFVTGDTMANFVGLAAARHALLARSGWEVEAQGLFGAPPISVLLSEQTHVSVGKALSLLGLGRDRVLRVPADEQGRMRADRLPHVEGPAIVCAQSGNVNTGASDPFPEIVRWARAREAWVHVDGAFGLWGSASPELRPGNRGVEGADSWALDAHKWLNVPYDSGIAFVRDREHLVAAMSLASASYLSGGGRSSRQDLAPELSRRARGVEVWAALLSLGRSGLAGLLNRSCAQARRFARGLEEGGFRVLNEVVLNQVLVSFGSDEETLRVVEGVQADGTCWCGSTVWRGHPAMRISVSSGKTTDEDVDRSVEAILAVARSGSSRQPSPVST
jgi:glutamate/tyrosine decarboxylase-like PLP-dependent enzyme